MKSFFKLLIISLSNSLILFNLMVHHCHGSPTDFQGYDKISNRMSFLSELDKLVLYQKNGFPENFDGAVKNFENSKIRHCENINNIEKGIIINISETGFFRMQGWYSNYIELPFDFYNRHLKTIYLVVITKGLGADVTNDGNHCLSSLLFILRKLKITHDSHFNSI